MPSQDTIDGLWALGAGIVFVTFIFGITGLAVWLGFRKRKP